MLRFALPCLLLACASAPDPVADDASRLASLSGTFADAAPYAYGEAFGHRTFTFDQGRWTLEFVLALDPALERKVFAFRTLGEYRIDGPSAVVEGAHEAVFTEEEKHLTLLTSDAGLAQAFGLAACGLVPGREKDISVDGCSLWKPVAVCGEDHDLLALEGDELRFGVRPPDNDMCSSDKRPTALTPPVVRVR